MFEFPVTLKQYAEWFRFFYPQQTIKDDNANKATEQEAGDGLKLCNGIRSKWERYEIPLSLYRSFRPSLTTIGSHCGSPKSMI
jgi:hypothetical protein